MTSTIRKADVVLDVVDNVWRTTLDLTVRLHDRGFTWRPKDTRGTLHGLFEAGLVQRRDAGKGYEWRLKPAGGLAGTPVYAADMTPLPAAARDALLGLSERLAELLAVAPPVAPNEVFIGDDAALGTLVTANHDLVGRIVKRAVYQTGRELLAVLDGWIEGMRQNAGNESGGWEDVERFHADDIRRMVNDAMRLMGAPEHRIPQAGE